MWTVHCMSLVEVISSNIKLTVKYTRILCINNIHKFD